MVYELVPSLLDVIMLCAKCLVRSGSSAGCDRVTSSLAKAVVMFIDEPFYDDACLKKIFTGATPHHNSLVKSSRYGKAPSISASLKHI